MNSVFFTRRFEITPELTVSDLQIHANQFLRYNNINDLVHNGPHAIAWFLKRANALFRRNYRLGRPGAELGLSYLSVFCRSVEEDDRQALPVYDFLQVRIEPGGKTRYGVMFSSQMREYYRDRLEHGLDTSQVPVDQAFFKSIFTRDSPSTGILDTYPIIMIPRGQSENGPSLTHIYLSSLGLKSKSIQPLSSSFPFRFYFKNDLDTEDDEIMAAISATGQAMFEIARPNLYPVHLADKPRFDMQHLLDVKWEQHKAARLWVFNHRPCVDYLLALHGLTDQALD